MSVAGHHRRQTRATRSKVGCSHPGFSPGRSLERDLAQVYSQLEGLTHNVRPIPTGLRHSLEEDIALSEWHMSLKSRMMGRVYVAE